MSAPPPALPPGVWGGEQVVLQVGPDTAVLQLGCAQGEFAAPIRLDPQGRFAVPGTFSAFAGGPTTASDRPAKAEYQGALSGKQLVLTVRQGAATDTYRLTLGVQSKVIRCL